MGASVRLYGARLAIVKELTEAMGGTVEVMSEPGRLTAFTVRLATPHATAPRLRRLCRVVTLDDVERRGTDDRRAGPPHAAAALGHALSCSSEGRALKASSSSARLVQGARRAEQALAADGRREARRRISISAGNIAQLSRGRRREAGVDALIVMLAGRRRPEGRATRGYGAAVDEEADGPTTAFDRCTGCTRRPAELIHPFERSRVIAGQERSRWRSEDGPWPDVVVVRSAAAALSGIATGAEGAAVGRARDLQSSRSSRPRCTTGSQPEVRAVTRRVQRTRSVALRRRELRADLHAARVESVLVSRRSRRGVRWLYARTKLACESAPGLRTLSCRQSDRRAGLNVVAVVSGGNVAPRQAAAILAGR